MLFFVVLWNDKLNGIIIVVVAAAAAATRDMVGFHQGGRWCGLDFLISYSDSGGGSSCSSGPCGPWYNDIGYREIFFGRNSRR